MPGSFFRDTRVGISKFMWRHKRPRIARVILNKKNSTVSVQTWFQGRRQSHRVKDNMAPIPRQVHRYVEQKRGPRLYFRPYRPLIFDKDAKSNKHWRKDDIFSKWYWLPWMWRCRKWRHRFNTRPAQNTTADAPRTSTSDLKVGNF